MTNMLTAVQPVSRSQIRKVTESLRQMTGVKLKTSFCVVKWLEFKFLPLIGFELGILEEKEMGDNHGLTDHEHKMVYLREDIYEGACAGQGRDRMTILHEAGHCVLHTPDRVVYHRNFQSTLPTYKDPEWQAKAFAGEFMIPSHLLRIGMTVAQISKEFGVSKEAAEFQARKVYEKEGILKFSGSADKTDPLIVWMR